MVSGKTVGVLGLLAIGGAAAILYPRPAPSTGTLGVVTVSPSSNPVNTGNNLVYTIRTYQPGGLVAYTPSVSGTLTIYAAPGSNVVVSSNPFTTNNGAATVNVSFGTQGTYPVQATIGSVQSVPFNEIVNPVAQQVGFISITPVGPITTTVGSPNAFTLTCTDPNHNALTSATTVFLTSSASGNLTTNASGVATFTATYTSSGTDVISAAWPATGTASVFSNNVNVTVNPVSTTSHLTISSQTTTGSAITGLFMGISPNDASGNASIFTPNFFNLTNGATYSVTATLAFSNLTFSKWSDNTTNNVHSFNISTASAIAAIYTTAVTPVLTSVTVTPSPTGAITAGTSVTYTIRTLDQNGNTYTTATTGTLTIGASTTAFTTVSGYATITDVAATDYMTPGPSQQQWWNYNNDDFAKDDQRGTTGVY